MTPRDKALMHHRRHKRIVGAIQRKTIYLSTHYQECSPYVRNRLIELEYERRGIEMPVVVVNRLTLGEQHGSRYI